MALGESLIHTPQSSRCGVLGTKSNQQVLALGLQPASGSLAHGEQHTLGRNLPSPGLGAGLPGDERAQEKRKEQAV